jgi:hypothetical protein
MAYWTPIQVKTVSLSHNYFLILKSYLHSRHFLVKVETKYTDSPQSMLAYPTAVLPTSPESTTATFADDHINFHINKMQLPQEEDVKYLELQLDRRLTWHKHIFTKRKQQGITLTKMYWLL